MEPQVCELRCRTRSDGGILSFRYLFMNGLRCCCCGGAFCCVGNDWCRGRDENPQIHGTEPGLCLAFTSVDSADSPHFKCSSNARARTMWPALSLCFPTSPVICDTCDVDNARFLPSFFAPTSPRKRSGQAFFSCQGNRVRLWVAESMGH